MAADTAVKQSLAHSAAATTWRHVRRQVIFLAAVLLALELLARTPPIHALLANALDPYENLLWYSPIMPAYQEQLTRGQHYNLWLVGSSYIMSGLNPQSIQTKLSADGFDALTVQNYGMSLMRNMADMAEVYDRWMFQMDRPEYIVIGVSQQNVNKTSYLPAVARSSPMENMFVFRSTLNDYAGYFLYTHSDLFRYTLLARNATFVPREQAVLQPYLLGGFIEVPTTFSSCDSSSWLTPEKSVNLQPYSGDAFARLDRLIDVIQAYHIPVMVVDIPLTYCGMRQLYLSYEQYQDIYLKPLAAHLAARGVAFFDLDTPFYARIPPDQQYLYYENAPHPNKDGAVLLSQWAADYIHAWLESLQ